MRNTIDWPYRADRKPLVIAHRGASGHATENTLAAFRLAAELGADMWEIDVQLSADGIPVVSHDAALERVFGASGEIAALSFAEIRKRTPDLPSLAEVIDLATDLDQSLYVEIKAEGAGPVASRMLLDKGFTKAGIGSFNVAEIAALAKESCPFPLAVLVPLDADPFERAEQSRADIIHLCWERGGERPQDLVTAELLARAERLDLGIVLWHEERPAILRDIMPLPVLGICTNEPDLMVKDKGLP
jgi:glycerophosphoryl diester phosphodiesterase